MKRDKEWLKEKLNTEKYYRETSELKAKTTYGELYDRGIRDGISVALEFIEQLDEPEKVVVPSFIADYIERAKPRHDSLYQAMEERAGEEVNEWIQAFYNSDKFVRAWLYGYEVEDEQKYQVIIRDGKYIIRLFLCKDKGNVVIGTNEYYIEKYPEATHLTEQEIKDYDERYWAFAEEVTE